MLLKPDNIREFFLRAVELASPEERAAYLDEACAGDEGARRRVDALLIAHERPESLLDEPGVKRATAGEYAPTHVAGAISERCGTQVGHYKLLQEIGEGGFGVVYMAEQTRPVRRKVALKIIKPGMDTKEVIARFEAERQALALMDHPNIAKVHDGGATESGLPYFVMELVDGIPITDFCDQNEFTTRERLQLFVLVCQAVGHAHQKGVIHRDIKPSNVLVTLHDGVPVPRIIDFGIAKATNQQLTEKTSFTRFGQMMGTPLYMSPEQAERSGLDVDTRSDIYSLGVLLYELLTGGTPFDRERLREAGLDEVQRWIRHQDPLRPSMRVSTLGEAATTICAQRKTDPNRLSQSLKRELDWIVMKALEKDRTRRYETASSFAIDVQRYLKDEAVEACPPSTMYRFRKFVRRHKAAFTMAASIATALILAVVGLAVSNAFVAQAYQEVSEAHQQLQVAEQDRTLQVGMAKLNEARALRHTHRPGRRFESLERLSEAAGIFQSLDVLDENELALRNEAIACMALRGDLRPVWKRQFPVPSWWVAFDAELGRYARPAEGGGIAIYRVTASGEHEELARLPSFETGGEAFWFSADGRFLAARYGDGSDCRVWDVDEEKVVCRTGAAGPYNGATDFSDDSSTFAVIDPESAIRIFEVPSGELRQSLAISRQPSYVRFQPHSQKLAVAHGSVVEIWDVELQERARRFTHTGAVDGIDWSDDGEWLAVVSTDDCATLWHAETGRRSAFLRGGAMEVTLTQRGDFVATWTRTYDTLLWDPIRCKQLVRTPGRCLQFRADGRRLAFNTTYEVGVWEVDSGEEYLVLPWAQEGHPRGITFILDGQLLVSCRDGVQFWEWDTGRLISHLDLGAVESVLFDATTRSLITSGRSGVHRWPLSATGRRLQVGPPETLHGPMPGSWAWTGSASMGLNDGSVAVVIDEATAVVLDPEGANQPVFLRGQPGCAFVALSPDGRWAVTGSWLGESLWQWNSRTGERVRDLWPGFGSASAAFSPDGRWLVASRGREYQAWHVSSWEPAWSLARDGAVDSPGPVAFSPDSRLLAVRPSHTVLRLVETATGREVASLEAPEAAHSIHGCFAPDGSALAEGTQELIGVWNLRRIRERLAQMGLDWDLPGYAPAVHPAEKRPWVIEVDYGRLASEAETQETERADTR